MSRAQRFVFLGIAAVIAVVALIVLSSTGDDEQEATGTGAQATATATAAPTAPDETATATPTPTPTPTATPKPEPPLVTPGQGDQARVQGGGHRRASACGPTSSDEVHVHGYDLMKDIEPGKTITFSFPASITGIFEIELEDAGEQIAQLRVDPR